MARGKLVLGAAVVLVVLTLWAYGRSTSATKPSSNAVTTPATVALASPADALQGRRDAVSTVHATAPSTATPPPPETLTTWYRELPRIEGLPADVHFAPSGVAQAGERFGAIFEAARANPNYRPEAAAFFGRCVEDGTVLDGIRALCLHNWREFRAVDAAEPRADERIRRIADFLPKNPKF